MYALGLVYWLYERPIDATVRFLEEQFEKKRKRPELADLNIRALKAGYNFGETAEMFPVRYKVPPAKLAPGVYRKISGNEATALGFVVAAPAAWPGRPRFAPPWCRLLSPPMPAPTTICANAPRCMIPRKRMAVSCGASESGGGHGISRVISAAGKKLKMSVPRWACWMRQPWESSESGGRMH
jgi:hypothetical protein